jgi:hypothetical protein
MMMTFRRNSLLFSFGERCKNDDVILHNVYECRHSVVAEPKRTTVIRITDDISKAKRSENKNRKMEVR